MQGERTKVMTKVLTDTLLENLNLSLADKSRRDDEEQEKHISSGLGEKNNPLHYKSRIHDRIRSYLLITSTVLLDSYGGSIHDMKDALRFGLT